MLKQRVLAFSLRHFEILCVDVQFNVHARPLRYAITAQNPHYVLVILKQTKPLLNQTKRAIQNKQEPLLYDFYAEVLTI